MIERFEISSFKSISFLSIDLGQINIFPGANDAGKSNILEALGIVSASVFGIDDDESLLRLGVCPGVLPRLYKTSNIHSERSVQISFSARSRQCEYRISLLNPQDTSRPQWDYKTETFISENFFATHAHHLKILLCFYSMKSFFECSNVKKKTSVF